MSALFESAALFTTLKSLAHLTSMLHYIWSRKHGGTIGNTPRYAPTDCFETFPLPLRDDASLGAIMGELHDVRAAYMLCNAHGITATYNRFHDPSEGAAEIQRLRELHAELDRRVVQAYGWTIST